MPARAVVHELNGMGRHVLQCEPYPYGVPDLKASPFGFDLYVHVKRTVPYRFLSTHNLSSYQDRQDKDDAISR